MDPDYYYEDFTNSHYSQFNVLYQNAFKKKLTFGEFCNRFDTKSRGLNFIGFIAFHRPTGQAAAFYGVFPLTMFDGDLKFLAAVSGDTMTHSKHRKKGLFVNLAMLTFEKCKKSGIQFIYGLPNAQSYYGFVTRLGWHHVNDLTEWNLSLRLKISPVQRILKYASFLRPLFNAYAHLVLKKYIVKNVVAFSHSNTKSYFTVCRDLDYIKYKEGIDRIFIKIEKIIIWIRLSDVIWIGDFNELDQVNDSVIIRLKHLARLLGYNSIRYGINKEISLPLLMKEFKKTHSFPICYLNLEDKETINKLLLTPADFDTW